MAKNTASSQDNTMGKRNPGNEQRRGNDAAQLSERTADGRGGSGGGPGKGRDGGPSVRSEGSGTVHAHRTAKVVELVCSSTESFQDAIECGVKDASATTRGITGAHVQNMSVKCREGKIVEYKVDLKVAFGIERTPSVDSDE